MTHATSQSHAAAAFTAAAIVVAGVFAFGDGGVDTTGMSGGGSAGISGGGAAGITG